MLFVNMDREVRDLDKVKCNDNQYHYTVQRNRIITGLYHLIGQYSPETIHYASSPPPPLSGETHRLCK